MCMCMCVCVYVHTLLKIIGSGRRNEQAYYINTTIIIFKNYFLPIFFHLHTFLHHAGPTVLRPEFFCINNVIMLFLVTTQP